MQYTRGFLRASTRVRIFQVKPNNVVDIRYRVEKLGKRSYDGISGEVRIKEETESLPRIF